MLSTAKSKIYTGIGSRKCPDHILERMRLIAIGMAENGYTLRSGGAPGADTSFENGCDMVGGKKEIYLPWKNFQNNPSPLFEVSQQALDVAERVWDESRSYEFWYLPRPIKLLMARNAYQIVGETLDKESDFVICWTPDGCTSAAKRIKQTGGTGQAIAHASDLNIPVFNLKNENAITDYLEFIT
jgi:hypothetical protein